MKLATLDNGTRDGALIVVRRDGEVFADATDIVPTLQGALDRWEEVAGQLRARSAALEAGELPGVPLDVRRLLAPLPRAYEWVDGSAYVNHVVLVRKARGAEPPETLLTEPLVYQGGSSRFLAPTEPIPLTHREHGLDFEAELAVVLADTPIGVDPEDAPQYIRLFGLVNDLTLRNLIPGELRKGFGFFTSKPATAMAPFLVTPDELEGSLLDGRVHLDMLVHHNGRRVGHANAGPEMHFSFHDLLAHITKTRAFTAGTILGSGTVSNEDPSKGYSCIAELRMREIIGGGEAVTPYMSVGDTIHIEMKNGDGESLFGAINQKVVQG